MLAAAVWVVFRKLVSEVFTGVDVDACLIKKTRLVSSRFRFEFHASVSSSSYFSFFAFLLKNVVANCVRLAYPVEIYI